MKVDFQETTKDLLKRIDIHSQYGSRDIDAWMLEILQLQKGIKILDVGCGAGKQCFSYYHALEGDADITGTDVSESLARPGNGRKPKGQQCCQVPAAGFQPALRPAFGYLRPGFSLLCHLLCAGYPLHAQRDAPRAQTRRAAFHHRTYAQ